MQVNIFKSDNDMWSHCGFVLNKLEWKAATKVGRPGVSLHRVVSSHMRALSLSSQV